MSMVRWFIDCDPGCDDAIALALLASQLPIAKVEILTVAGNVGVEQTTWNACRVVAACKKQWPVYQGCGRSLSGEAIPAASVHGRDGLGDVPNDILGHKGIAPPKGISAVERLMKQVRTEEHFVLVCTGPLTNLATALNLMSLEQQVKFWKQCQRCVVMGGAFEVPGNITAAAEFNCHFDPVALHMVLESWREANKPPKRKLNPIQFVPLDVTETVGVPLHGPIEAKAERSLAEFLKVSLRKYAMFHGRFCEPPAPGGAGFGTEKIRHFKQNKYLHARAAGESGLGHVPLFCYLHDPLAVWAALKWSDGKMLKMWRHAQIAVDIGHGPHRGRILNQRDKVNAPTRLLTLGTHVRWLAPGTVFRTNRQEFLKSVCELLHIL